MEAGKRSPINARRSHWKGKLREICLKRVQHDRSQLLRTIRGLGDIGNKEACTSTLRTIVDHELVELTNKRDKGTAVLFNGSNGMGDMIWEYETPQTIVELPDSEYEELMLAMEQALYVDLKEEDSFASLEDRWLDDYENVQVLEEKVLEEKTLANLLERSQIQDSGVLCPVCRRGSLHENNKAIFCDQGCFRLEVQDQEVGLEFLQTRLAELLDDHYNSGCQDTPVFFVENRFGFYGLYMCCHSCSSFQVVF